jgi:hypothetical protein
LIQLVANFIYLVDETAQKKTIRHYQTIAFSFLLSLVRRCLDVLSDQLSKAENMQQAGYHNLAFLIPIGNLCTWLALRPTLFSQFSTYGKVLSEKVFETVSAKPNYRKCSSGLIALSKYPT